MNFYFLPLRRAVVLLVIAIGPIVSTFHSALAAEPTPAASKPSLDGVWKVTRYVRDGMSGINKAEAAEWIGRLATIKGNSIRFEFDKIPKYKKMFSDVTTCSVTNPDSPRRGKTTEFYDALETAEIRGDSAWLYASSCKYNPFESFVVTDKTEMIMRWDGVIFILQRISTPAAPKPLKRKKQIKTDSPVR